MYCSDFGWGRPVYSSFHPNVGEMPDGIGLINNTREEDGSMDIILFLKNEDMQRFLADEEFHKVVKSC